MRAKSPLVVNAVRRMNRALMNPLQMRTAGTPGAYASVVRHLGHTHQVDRPEIVTIEAANHHFSAEDQRAHRLFCVDECLRVPLVEGDGTGDDVDVR